MECRADQRNAAGLTASLTDLVAAPGGLSETWRDLGERAFADTVGVLVAGASDPAVPALAAASDGLRHLRAVTSVRALVDELAEVRDVRGTET